MKISFEFREREYDMPYRSTYIFIFVPYAVLVPKCNWTIVVVVVIIIFVMAEMRNAFSPNDIFQLFFSPVNCFLDSHLESMGFRARATGHSIDTDVSHHCITSIGFSFRLSELQQALHYRIISQNGYLIRPSTNRIETFVPIRALSTSVGVNFDCIFCCDHFS